MKKVFKYLKFLWFGLILGMKKTEDETFHLNGNELDTGSTVNQNVSEHSVAKALLRGEVTQEVVDLRYRTYEVARESAHYTYFSPTLAKKKKLNDNKFVKIENDEKREVVTIQENKQEVETVTDTLLRIGDDGKYVDRAKQYNIVMERDGTTRFKLEQFAKKVVVKKGDTDTEAILDVYVSKYPDDKVFISKAFVHEIERIKNQKIRSDVTNITRLSFETYKAYKLDDMIRFEFGDLKFECVIEYDGDYVIRFVAKIIDGGTDMTKEFYSERMAKKYAEKAPKELTATYDPNMNIRTYRCADCGKVVTYDARALDNLEVKRAKLVAVDGNNVEVAPSDEDGDARTDGSTTEFLDFEMSEWDYGRMLCQDCIRKEQKKLYRQTLKT